jgi:hypothetical protein
VSRVERNRIGARVRKSRQKEAAGAADAGLMQIEWSGGEVLKWAGVGTGAEEEVREGVGARVDGPPSRREHLGTRRVCLSRRKHAEVSLRGPDGTPELIHMLD